MGAHNIDFKIKKQASESEVRTAFKDRQERDKEENGPQDGYSGDFQTIQEIRCHFDKIYDSYDDAYDYALDNAEKWHYGIAVHYKDKSTNGIYTIIVAWGAC